MGAGALQVDELAAFVLHVDECVGETAGGGRGCSVVEVVVDGQLRSFAVTKF